MQNDLTQAKKLIQECLQNKNPYLDLGNCGITDLNDLPELFECTHLETLILSNQWFDAKTGKIVKSKNKGFANKIKYVTANIAKLGNLNTLKIGGISYLNKYGALVVTYWNIWDIHFLAHLTQLQSLYLSYNQISDIPEFIFKLRNWKSIVNNIIEGNSISNPPIELIKQGKEAVLAWFRATKAKLNEIKIILIGEPEAGKTSLLRRLKYNEFDKDEQQTDGINIVEIDFADSKYFRRQKKLHGIKGRFWDFGGQEIMSATHRLFLTNRSIYILLLEARNDKDIEKQVRDWAHDIIAKGGDSPILVVANKIDINPSFDFANTFGLQREFPQIKEFIKISCLEPSNLNQIKEALEKVIPQSGFFNSEVDIRYIRLKEKILKETQDKDYIDERTFDQICEDPDVDLRSESSKFYAIDFLDKLGIALHFPNIYTSKFYVLDPNWLTTGIYRIITSKFASQKNGKIHFNDLEYILNEEDKKLGTEYHSLTNKRFEYKYVDERKFLADVLLEYKLAFKVNDNEYIIPSLLERNPSDRVLEPFYSKDEDTLDFVFDYKNLPKYIIPQILVDFQRTLTFTDYWRDGCVIKKDDTRALIHAVGNQIIIKLRGGNKIKRRDLMIHIRALMEKINNDLPIPPKKLIPLPGTNRQGYVEYEILLRRLSKGKSIYIYHEDLDDEQEFKILELLDGIGTEDEILKKLNDIDSKVTKTLHNTEDLKNRLDDHFSILIEYAQANQQIKDLIVPAINKIEENMKEKIADLILDKIQKYRDSLDDKLNTILDDVNKTDDVNIKLKLSVPLLNLIGINVETEFDIKSWSERMYNKYKMQIFKLFGYL